MLLLYKSGLDRMFNKPGSGQHNNQHFIPEGHQKEDAPNIQAGTEQSQSFSSSSLMYVLHCQQLLRVVSGSKAELEIISSKFIQ